MSSLREFNLVDKTLYYLGTSVYQNSLVSDRYSRYFQWVKDRPDLPTFYTYASLEDFKATKDDNIILLESSAIISPYLSYVYSNSGMFNRVYTHNSALLKLPNSLWIPGGGIWIGTPWGGGQVAITPKSKLCSMVTSSKRMCPLHVTRSELAKYLHTTKQVGVDIYGDEYGGFVKAEKYLTEYMFSIVVENNLDDMYFTEKLLNCFATGTIPVYLGARKIEEKFNVDGMLRFNTMAEFFTKCAAFITPEFYNSRLLAVRDNFERCEEFACIEDYMWENYMKDEYEN